MLVRRAVAAIGSAALVMVGMVAVTPPAQAAFPAHEVTITCTSDVYLPGSPGDYYDFTFTSSCPGDGAEIWNIIFGDPRHLGFLDYPSDTSEMDWYYDCDDFCSNDPSDWYAGTYTGSGTMYGVRLMAENDNGDTLAPGGAVAMVNLYSNPNDFFIYWGGTAVSTPIPMWVQGVGRTSAEAPCVEGWTASWDLWPNGGTGGWVCAREIPMYGSQ